MQPSSHHDSHVLQRTKLFVLLSPFTNMRTTSGGEHRTLATRLFRSEEMTKLFGAVAEKTDKGTISLRRDRVLHTDVRLSRKLIDLVRKAQVFRVVDTAIRERLTAHPFLTRSDA